MEKFDELVFLGAPRWSQPSERQPFISQVAGIGNFV